MSRRTAINIDDYYRTGQQDCANTISIDEFDYESGLTAEEIVDAFEFMSFEDWLEQFDEGEFADDPNLARACYEAWQEGWKTCARRHVVAEMERIREEHQTYWLAIARDPMFPGSGNMEIVENFDELDDALTAMARLGAESGARVYDGNLNYWNWLVAYIDEDGQVVAMPAYELEVDAWRKRYKANPMRHNPPSRPKFFYLQRRIEQAPPDLVRRGRLDLRDYSDDELINEMGSDEELYEALTDAGANKRVVEDILDEFFLYTPEQLAELLGQLREEREENWSLNPTEDTRRAAVGKYKEFWRQNPTKVGEFPAGFKIPTKVHKLGKGVNVLYESKKTDPESLKKPKKALAYIHDHDAGVHVYDLMGKKDSDVPEFITHAQALVCLGKCLGFAWKDDDGKHEADGTQPLPDLWCTVDGRALLVIQSRREVLAMIWGGGLGVEARGIVG